MDISLNIFTVDLATFKAHIANSTVKIVKTRMYPLCVYILGVLTYIIDWEGDETLILAP